MEARLPVARRTELACRHTALMAPRQLDLVLDDVRFRAMTPAERRAVLHHEGYISWAEFERNQALLAGNAFGKEP